MASMELRLPNPLDCANLATEWPKWKQTFLIYMIANKRDGDSEQSKIATFLWLIGQRGVEIFNTLFPNDGSFNGMFGAGGAQIAAAAGGVVGAVAGGVGAAAGGSAAVASGVGAAVVGGGAGVPAGGGRTLADVIKAFDDYCLPRRNVTMEAFKFNMIVQKEKQSFGNFETELRTQLQYCEFECTNCHTSYADRLLRDRIIVGVQDKKLQLKLLDGKDDPLGNVIETCKVFEAAAANKQLLDRKCGNAEIKSVVEQTQDTGDNAELQEVAVVKRTCYNCGQAFNGQHFRHCPAINIRCNKCGKIGHFQKFCKAGGGADTSKGRLQRTDDKKKTAVKTVRSIDWRDSGKSLTSIGQGDSAEFTANPNIYRYRVNLNDRVVERVRWMKTFLIQDWPITFKLDTGSDINCVPLNLISKLKIELSKLKQYRVLDYSSNEIKVHGQVSLICVDKDSGEKHVISFVVVDNEFEPLLGLESCVTLGLLKRTYSVYAANNLPSDVNTFVATFKELFEGLGKCPGTCSIILKEGSVPSLHYKKRIPLSLQDRLRDQLNEMVAQGIISSVDYPTDWVNNIQIVEKPNGSLRICLDPKPLNACIKREHFLIPKIEDIMSNLTNKKVFTVLDLRNGFWQMELDRQSSDLTTFMTPFGRYKWNRVPFGINSAPEMFQKKMVQIFGDIPGVEVYFDDLTISGKDFEEHDRTLRLVMERASKYNIRFNDSKIQYRCSEIRLMGHIISDGTIRPDNKYIRAITDIQTPTNKTEVMRLLGLFKYLARFIPNLSKRTALMREITRKEAVWQWTAAHDEELRGLLQVISTSPVLTIYDPAKPVVIQTDSSKDGIGSVLLQEGKPVAYASRCLTKSEKKWAQIEKELLAIVFACERFHYFLYGRDFQVQSDHKPLATLINRDIDSVTARLQRMFMFLLKYPGLSIVFTPGKEMLVADCLSRAPLNDPVEDDLNLSGLIHSITKRVCMSEENYKTCVEALQNDERYSRICKYVQEGWPSYHKLDDLSQRFYKVKDELHFEENLLFKDHRLVIPTELQRAMCKWLHAPHMGIEKTLARARIHVYWPGMTQDIIETVKDCSTCEVFKRNNQKEPLVQDGKAEYPFHKVSVDIFEYGGESYLALIDAYSGLLCAEMLRDKSATQVIKSFDNIFGRYGYPTEIRCDNVPFNSEVCDRYADECNFRFVFSSPRYPQSNGLAEKGVAIAKNILKRCLEVGEVSMFQYRLLEYNNTPIASMKMSPAEIFFGRLLKTKLPVDSQLLHSGQVDKSEVNKQIEKKRNTQKKYYDQHAKPLPVLNEGERVMFKKNGKEWHYGKIVRKVNARSYIILDNFNNHFRRNRRFISKTNNNVINTSDLLFEESLSRATDTNSSNVKPVNPRENMLATENNEQTPVLEERQEPTLNASFYDTASEGSHTDEENEYVSDNECQDIQRSVQSRTRSGRVVRPPQLYGEWTI